MQAAEAFVAVPVIEADPTQSGTGRWDAEQSGATGSQAARSVQAERSAQSATEQSRTRCAQIMALDKSIAALTAERAALLVAERDSAVWKASGFPSFEAWRGHMSGEGLRTARTQVNVATVLAESPETSVALAAGEVTLIHAQVLGRVRKAADRTSAGALSSGDHAELLDLARGQDADSFSKSADRWLARRDSVAHDATHEEIRRRRYLTISTTAAGTHIKGFLDEVAGRTLQVAVEAAMTRPGTGDDRDYGQRCADALIDVAQVAVAGGTLKTGALVRPHVSLIMTEATFAEARRELQRRACAGRDAGETAGGVAGTGTDTSTSTGTGTGTGTTETAEHGVCPSGQSAAAGRPGQVEPAIFEDGTPVPLNELARILCDAQVTRVVMDAEDVPVNLGRTARLYSGEQRRAIIARDRHCQFRGCTQPSRWCEVHHIDWWDRDGGDTSITNGILLCVFHHHEVHKNNLTIRPDSTGTMVVRVARHRSAPMGSALGTREPALGTREPALETTGAARPRGSAMGTARSTTGTVTRAETGTVSRSGTRMVTAAKIGAGADDGAATDDELVAPTAARMAGGRAAGGGAPRRTVGRSGTGPGRGADPPEGTVTRSSGNAHLPSTMEAVGTTDGRRDGRRAERFGSQRPFEGW